MVRDFYNDLANAREAEHLVAEVLSKLTDDYSFEEVGDKREYFYKGDIKAHDDLWDMDSFVEVKDDSCIARTKNVLCEYKVYYKCTYSYGKGNMYSDYDTYSVVSKEDNLIYMLDFDVLRENYKKGKHKIIDHYDQTTYCYLCSVDMLCECGAMKYIIKYDYNEDNGYYPINVEVIN